MMPGPGEQHKGVRIALNPFEEVKPRVNEYTAQEIATLSSRLEKQLGPEYISSRPGAAGQKVHYLAADKCINLANEVFGFNGWSSGIQNIQIDFVDESPTTGKVSLGLSVIVRVTLRDGTYHEDIGYGHIENCKGKAAAFEKAKKEGTTDALKRVLRNFGNLLGNCIYDKEYVAKVTKLKAVPSKKWDSNTLHRHRDYRPVKKEPVDANAQKSEFTHLKRESLVGQDDAKANDAFNIASSEDAEDEFGSDGFDEADFSVQQEHPDEVSLDTPSSSEEVRHSNDIPKRDPTPGTKQAHNGIVQQMRPPPLRRHAVNPQNAPSLQPLLGAPDPNTLDSLRRVEFKTAGQRPNDARIIEQQQLASTDSQALSRQASLEASEPLKKAPASRGSSQITEPISHKLPASVEFSTNHEHDHPTGFFTARAAESIQNAIGIPLKAPAFNPHLDSPSIRKTAGVDHTKTKPVEKEAVRLPPRPNFVNPQTDKARRVGMPVGTGSPLQNRNSYRVPQMKRQVEMNIAQNLRPALGDLTLGSVNAPPAMADLKRQKIMGINDAGTALVRKIGIVTDSLHSADVLGDTSGSRGTGM